MAGRRRRGAPRRAGGTEPAGLDNEPGSSTLRSLLGRGGGAGRPVHPQLSGPTCEERAGCQNQVSQRLKAPRNLASLSWFSH